MIWCGYGGSSPHHGGLHPRLPHSVLVEAAWPLQHTLTVKGINSAVGTACSPILAISKVSGVGFKTKFCMVKMLKIMKIIFMPPDHPTNIITH